jgi:hypothetical protein
MKRILAITALLLLAPTTHAQGTNTCQANNCPPVVTVNANPTGNVCVNAPQVTIYNGAAYGCVNGAMAITGGGGGGTTTNALTAAATGGAAPGTTFNGSAAVTFDYHSFGAQVNLSLIEGTLTDGDMCTYTASGTLLNCNTAAFNPASPGAIGGTTPAAGNFTTVAASTSVAIAGGTPMTGQSSAQPQIVTCAPGGTSTQYCGADGAWHTPSAGTPAYNLGAAFALSTTTPTVALTNGAVQTLTLTGNTTIAFTQPVGYVGKVTLIITQAAGANDTVTWTSVKWPSGIAPVMTATASAIDVYSCILDTVSTYCTAGQSFQ